MDVPASALLSMIFVVIKVVSNMAKILVTIIGCIFENKELMIPLNQCSATLHFYEHDFLINIMRVFQDTDRRILLTDIIIKMNMGLVIKDHLYELTRLSLLINTLKLTLNNILS